MIKFFRKIRQNLLIEGKTGQYFKYAIGEIVLVVIGILIALQINHWNEAQKNKKTEIDYLRSLLSDLKNDINLQDSIVPVYDYKITILDSLLHQLQNLSPGDDTRKAYQYWLPALGFPDYRSKDHTIETLKSSGKIETLTDEKLRRKIQSYYDYSKIFYIHEEDVNSLLGNILLDQTIFDLRALQSDTDRTIPSLTRSENDIGALFNGVYLYQQLMKMTKGRL